MSKTVKPPLTEKERRALALQKALRENLRRRKSAVAAVDEASNGETPEEASPGALKEEF